MRIATSQLQTPTQVRTTVPGRPRSFPNGKERKQALNLQRCSPSKAVSEMPPYLSFQLQNYILTCALSYILKSGITSRPASVPRPASGLSDLCGLSVSNSRVIAASEMPPYLSFQLQKIRNSKFEILNSKFPPKRDPFPKYAFTLGRFSSASDAVTGSPPARPSRRPVRHPSRAREQSSPH